MMTVQHERGEQFKALHRPGEPLVLVNVWDAVTARIVEEIGFPAIATSSASVAWSRGFPDGERIGRETMLHEIELIARAVNVPVSADLESGYGRAPEEAAATAQGAIEAGAVGMNLEDSCGEEMLEAQEHADRISAIADVAAHQGVTFCVNARTDIYLREIGDNDAWRFAEAVRRSNLYLQAGAVCAFVPGVYDAETIEKLVKAIEGPVSILANASSPSVPELASLGVSRVSVGASSASLALAVFRQFAQGVKDRGDFSPLSTRIPGDELNRLFGG